MKIKENPYKYICDFYEEEFPCIGGKIFSVLSLVPVSLVIPKIPSLVKNTKQKLSILWLAPPGSGKSSISDEFSRITLNPISTSNMTPARLYHEIKKREGQKTSLVCPEVSIMFSNEEMIKLLEGYLGEESAMSRATMRNKNEENLNLKVNGCSYLAGTPQNISDKKIRDGLLGRTSPIITFFNQKQNDAIIDKINSRMGKDLVSNGKNIIHDYYQELFNIQEGKGQEFNPIKGYIISDEIRNEIGEYIKNLSYLKVILKKWGVHSARALEETYRFMIAYSFLNIYNREIKDSKLVITEEDCQMAKKLIKREAIESYKIFSAIERIDWYNIKNERDFRLWDLKMRQKKKNIPFESDVKSMMQGMINK